MRSGAPSAAGMSAVLMGVGGMLDIVRAFPGREAQGSVARARLRGTGISGETANSLCKRGAGVTRRGAN
ncbi:hypothetical protein DLREEDagr8_16450 [Dongia sp. agr-C8]